jgi:hypothetical protein
VKAKSAVFIVGLLLASNQQAHAQFDKFMKDMKGAADVLQQVTPSAPNAPTPPSAPIVQPAVPPSAPQGRAPVAANQSSATTPAGVSFDSDAYCEKVQKNQLVIDFKNAVRKSQEQNIRPGDKLMDMGRQLLDNEKGDLVDWFDKKLRDITPKPANNGAYSSAYTAEPEILNKLYKMAEECAAKVAKTDKFLFFAFDPMNSLERGGKSGVDLQMEAFWNGKGNLGYGGSDNLKRDSNPRRKPFKPFSSRWASLLAFAFDGGEEEVAITAGDLKGRFDSYFDAELQEKRVAQAKREQEEAAKKAEADKEAAAAAKRQAYDESPEGRLLHAYQYFQVVDVCHEIRKGYAVQFINDIEYPQLKTKMKSIEAKLKGSVPGKTTDQLWQQAEKENREYDVTRGMAGEYAVRVDLIDTIQTNNKTNWPAAKNDCDMISGWFRDVADEVLGKETIKKNF